MIYSPNKFGVICELIVNFLHPKFVSLSNKHRIFQYKVLLGCLAYLRNMSWIRGCYSTWFSPRIRGIYMDLKPSRISLLSPYMQAALIMSSIFFPNQILNNSYIPNNYHVKKQIIVHYKILVISKQRRTISCANKNWTDQIYEHSN